MEFKDFQQKVLDRFDDYLDELVSARDNSAELLKGLTEAQLKVFGTNVDFPSTAWTAMAAKGALPKDWREHGYSSRKDGVGRPVPNVTFKVPTGGGKTLLAAAGASRILHKYLNRNNGLILWIVPNEAIYTQTKKQLSNREHPYRQMLDQAAAGRVKILEKDTPLRRADVDSHLCILLLMLQSANRQTKETLRLFRDRGNVHGFTPGESEADKQEALLRDIPNLDCYGDEMFAIVKDSLGNALRIVRPIVVMDEGHHTYSPLAFQTLYGFNPAFVLELSATPVRTKEHWANCLVDVRGTDLELEHMIKLPINLTIHGGDDWRECLRQAWEQTVALQQAAEILQANTARYIRPIMLVQVERTGKDKQDTGYIHTQDVRSYLLTLGLHENSIAEKTSEVNELKDPEKQDLLSPTNSVRVIITKQALQEGWDCPFAYVLCSLAAANNMNAMTQLVGRILRQPDTLKTGDSLLDECYVHCYHASAGEVLKGIKRSLEEDGMGDLAGKISTRDPSGSSEKNEAVRQRRTSFINRIYLPKVLWVDAHGSRDLNWEGDVLHQVELSDIDVSALANKLSATNQVRATEKRRVGLEIITETTAGWPAEKLGEAPAFDTVYATRAIFDIVPNAWIGREIVGDLLTALRKNGWSDSQIGGSASFLIEELRKYLQGEVDQLAEAVFKKLVTQGTIQFRLRTDSKVWELPMTERVALPANPRLLARSDGGPVEKSLLQPVYGHELNGLELEVACYLDREATLKWWYRNLVSAGSYFLQGWRKNKVYPDIVFAMQPTEAGHRLVVLETKGNQLAGNSDTAYKSSLMKLLTDSYSFETVKTVGALEIELEPNVVVTCDLVYEDNWKLQLQADYFAVVHS